MTRIAAIVLLSFVVVPPLAAQDTTHAPAPAAAPATPAATVEVAEAAVAKAVVDRQPQDTGTTFPADVGQIFSWTKVTGAAGSSIHHVWFHGDTQVATSSFKWAARRGARGAGSPFPPIGPAPGTWRCGTRPGRS